MLNIGPQELILVLIIALVVVGPQRLPELGRTIGRALREFRKIQDDVKDTIKFDLKDEPGPSVRPRQSPRTPKPERNGEVTAEDAPSPNDAPVPTQEMPDAVASVAPEGVGQPGADASPETKIDPEPRAVE